MNDIPKDTDDIDEWFPEAAERGKEAVEKFEKQRKLIAEGHLFARVQPDEVRETVMYFHSIVGFDPDPYTREQWINGTKDWVRAHGQVHHLLGRTVDYMREKKLHIKSPRSCIQIANDIKHQFVNAEEKCPQCGLGVADCLDEWGTRKRNEKYGGGRPF